MVYADLRRQFDVTLRSAEPPGALQKVYEAKDFASRVPFEKVEAFETKVRELKDPPSLGAGIISSHGFQSGPLERGRSLGDNAIVRELYQLRPVEEGDWAGRIRSFHFAIMTQSLTAEDVRVTLANDKVAPATSFAANREASFLYDSQGQIVGNLLDIINTKLRSANSPDDPDARVAIDVGATSHLRIGDELFRVTAVSIKPAAKTSESNISADLSTAARDLLKDCLSDRTWIIPDPDKAVSATRTGLDVALTFKPSASAELEEVRLPRTAIPEEERHAAELTNAIQLQLLLRALRAGADRAPAGSEDLVRAIEDATELFRTKNLAAAEAAYWETCKTATSLVALVNLTHILHSRGDLEGALYLAHRTAELFPLEPNGFANMVVVLTDMDRFEEVRDIIDEAKVLHAGNPELLRLEGNLLIHDEQWDRGVRVFSQLALQTPNDPGASLGLALCEQRLNQPAAAAWDAQQAVARGLADGKRAVLAMRILTSTGDWKGALKAGEALLQRLDPSDSHCNILRLRTAEAAYECNELERSRILAKELAIDEPATHYLWGLLEFKAGAFAAASKRFQVYCDLHPDDARGWQNLFIALSAEHRTEEAYEVLSTPGFAKHDDATTWGLRIVGRVRSGRLNDAVALAARAESAGVDCGKLFMDLANEAAATGKIAQGAELRKASMQHSTTDGPTLAERAIDHIYQEAFGETSSAHIETMLTDAESRGASPEPILFARCLHALHGNNAAAIAALEPLALAALPSHRKRVLACEAMMLHRPHFAIRLLGDVPSPADVPAGIPTQPWPHPEAMRALCLMHTGRLAEALNYESTVESASPHPLHRLVLAHLAYAHENLQSAIQHLDAQRKMIGQATGLELALRALCLVESGEYGLLGDLLRAHFPLLPVTKCAERWAAQPRVQPLTLGMLDDFTRRSAILAVQMNPGVEHVLLVRRDGQLRRLIIPVLEWESAFSHELVLEEGSTPLLVRVISPPTRAIERLFGACLDGTTSSNSTESA